MRNGYLYIDSWAGRTISKVIVVGETPHRYRIKSADDSLIKLAGRDRWLVPGNTALVPKYAVRDHA